MIISIAETAIQSGCHGSTVQCRRINKMLDDLSCMKNIYDDTIRF